jgi:hypothetical protein
MRFSLAGVLWFVAFVAFGIAAVRSSSGFWVGATFLVTLGLLCASVLGAVVERRQGGVWWLGFALFGWSYFVALLIPPLAETARMPSRSLAPQMLAASNFSPPTTPPYNAPLQHYLHTHEANAVLIGQWYLVLIFARVGATVSCVFTKGLPWRRRPLSIDASSAKA